MAKYKVLLVDDNTQFTDMMKGYLGARERVICLWIWADLYKLCLFRGFIEQ